jgi:hypothetical protein
MKTTRETWKSWRKQAAGGRAMLVLMGIALVLGCGDGRPSRVPVSGRVFIDDKPLESGNIRFYPAEHRAASAKIEPDGRFTLSTYEFGDGVVPGQHPVSVMGYKLVNPKTLRWFAPKKYAAPETSALSFEVTEATDTAEIKLTWGGGKPFNERIIGGGE